MRLRNKVIVILLLIPIAILILYIIQIIHYEYTITEFEKNCKLMNEKHSTQIDCTWQFENRFLNYLDILNALIIDTPAKGEWKPLT